MEEEIWPTWLACMYVRTVSCLDGWSVIGMWFWEENGRTRCHMITTYWIKEPWVCAFAADKAVEVLLDSDKIPDLERISTNTDGSELLVNRVEEGYCLRPSKMACAYTDMSNCSIVANHNCIRKVSELSCSSSVEKVNRNAAGNRTRIKRSLSSALFLWGVLVWA